MKVERISYKKVEIVHTVPIYYRCGTFVSEKIGERKVREMWKEKDGRLHRCGFKNRFFGTLSMQFSHKKKDIYVNQSSKSFEFEGKVLNFVVTENFYFDIDDKKLRDYKLEKLLKDDV